MTVWRAFKIPLRGREYRGAGIPCVYAVGKLCSVCRVARVVILSRRVAHAHARFLSSLALAWRETEREG